MYMRIRTNANRHYDETGLHVTTINSRLSVYLSLFLSLSSLVIRVKRYVKCVWCVLFSLSLSLFGIVIQIF